MSLVSLRSAIITKVAERFTFLKAVEAHGGRFDADEITRIAVKTPAAFVSMIGVPRVETIGGQPTLAARWAIYLVAKASPTELKKRDEVVLEVAEALTAFVHGNRWSVETAHVPKNLRIENLYTPAVDRMGIALCAVSWEQASDLAALDLTTLDAFEMFFAAYDLAAQDGQIDTRDQLDLEQP